MFSLSPSVFFIFFFLTYHGLWRLQQKGRNFAVGGGRHFFDLIFCYYCFPVYSTKLVPDRTNFVSDNLKRVWLKNRGKISKGLGKELSCHFSYTMLFTGRLVINTVRRAITPKRAVNLQRNVSTLPLVSNTRPVQLFNYSKRFIFFCNFTH